MITLKNSEIEKIFNTLFVVDKASPELDFSIKFKNKENFKNLKAAYTSLHETFNEIFTKNWTKETANGKEVWVFWENAEVVQEEIKKIYDIEVEIDIKTVLITTKKDPVTRKTDTMGLVITSDQMENLETIFKFEFIEE